MKTFKYLIPLLLLTAFIGTSMADGDVAILRKVKGKADVKKFPDDTWINGAKKGFTFGSGGKIKTHDGSFAAIKFLDDGSLVRVRPNSEFTLLGEGKSNAMSKGVNVESGGLFVSVAKQKKGSFKVITATSVASVKGTEFYLFTDQYGNVKVVVTGGLVELLNRISGKIQNIGKGQTGTSNKDGTVGVKDSKDDDIPQQIEDTELEIRFEDSQGNKKTLKIELQNKK